MAKQYEAYNLRRVSNGFIVTKDNYYYGPTEDFVFTTWTEALAYLTTNEPKEIQNVPEIEDEAQSVPL